MTRSPSTIKVKDVFALPCEFFAVTVTVWRPRFSNDLVKFLAFSNPLKLTLSLVISDEKSHR